MSGNLEKRKDLEFFEHELSLTKQVVIKKEEEKKVKIKEKIKKKKILNESLKRILCEFLDKNSEASYTVNQIKNELDLKKRHTHIKEILEELADESSNKIDRFKTKTVIYYGINENKPVKEKKKKKEKKSDDTDEEKNIFVGEQEEILYYDS